MSESTTKYTTICSRKDIGNIFYPKAKVPSNGITKTYANNPKKQKQYEAMDLGTYCVQNGITGDMLVSIDGDILKSLIHVMGLMKDKICPKTQIPIELMEKFNAFIEFEQIKEQIDQQKKSK